MRKIQKNSKISGLNANIILITLTVNGLHTLVKSKIFQQKEGEGSSQGTRVKDSWTNTMGWGED